MKRFEYKVGTASEQLLNDLGAEGWEVCGMAESEDYYGLVYTFKRELPNRVEAHTVDAPPLGTPTGAILIDGVFPPDELLDQFSLRIQQGSMIGYYEAVLKQQSNALAPSNGAEDDDPS